MLFLCLSTIRQRAIERRAREGARIPRQFILSMRLIKITYHILCAYFLLGSVNRLNQREFSSLSSFSFCDTNSLSNRTPSSFKAFRSLSCCRRVERTRIQEKNFGKRTKITNLQDSSRLHMNNFYVFSMNCFIYRLMLSANIRELEILFVMSQRETRSDCFGPRSPNEEAVLQVGYDTVTH